MNFRVVVVTILMLLIGQKYTYADENTKHVITNLYIFRHGRIDKTSEYLELKEESKTEISNSAEKISCDSDTSQNDMIFYLVNEKPEEDSNDPEKGKNSKRFTQTVDQIVEGLKNRESCNDDSYIPTTEAIIVKNSSNPNYDDLQEIWDKITDDSVNYYNKIFVLSGEVINALLRPSTAQCPPKNAPCFMEKWQAVHDVLEYNKYEYDHRYSHESKLTKSTDFLYEMILYLRLHKMTKPYHSILPVSVEKISIDSEPPLSK